MSKAIIILGAGTVVLRPDSGDPATILVKVLDILGIMCVCVTSNPTEDVMNNDLRLKVWHVNQQ